ASGATGRSLLQSAQECGFDSSNAKHCLPETDFGWQDSLSFSAPQPITLPTSPGGPASPTGITFSVSRDYVGDGRRQMYLWRSGTDPLLFWLDDPTKVIDLSTLCDGGQVYAAD